MKASIKPLAAGAVVGLAIIAVPVVLTALLAGISNRPEIGYAMAGRGSLHPSHLLMLGFAGVYGAGDFKRDFWAPPAFQWHDVFGHTDLFAAQNAGQVYVGALAIAAIVGIGLTRGLIWSREIRFFTVAAVLAILYSLGKYTPAFRAMYEVMPGVSLYRRPADASFIFCALLALIGGYLIHRILTDVQRPPARWQRLIEVAFWGALAALAFWLALKVNMLHEAFLPIVWGVAFVALAIGALRLAQAVASRDAFSAAMLLAVFCTADLAWNNAPDESTGLPPAQFEALKADTSDETIKLLKARLKETAAPDRRDRVELVGVGYHWPNIGLIHDLDHLLGHNPLRLADFTRATAAPDTVAGPDQRVFSPLLPSFKSTMENLFGVRFIAISVPIGQIDTALKPGDLKQIARTKQAYVYENPDALPRVMLVGDWRKADFQGLLAAGFPPGFDPKKTVLLEREPRGFGPTQGSGTARIVSYRNTEVVVETENAAPMLLLLNDVWHPWWRASVDGDPVDILKANVLFRAVVVPAGKHTVRFTFHPFEGAWEELKAKVGLGK